MRRQKDEQHNEEASSSALHRGYPDSHSYRNLIAMARAAEVISKRDCPDNAPRDQITTVFFARRHSASEKT
jgi:hypothetical protein